jgi:hypothetical protein
MATKVTTQKELDAALKAGDERIIIDSPRGVWLELTSTGEAWVEALNSASVSAYGSASVSAYDSASVRASGSASVRASGSASVSAYDSASVRAYGSASVSAYGSASVSAYDSASVRAYGSASVRAYDSASVRASRFVAVHLHSASAHIMGGTVIDVTKLDLDKQEHWTEYHGVETTEDGDLVVYKAVGDNFKSGYGFEYPIGETVTAPDWNPVAFCGYGLHFSPSPAQAQAYHSEATRFLKCAVAPADAVILDGSATWTTPKLKARAARVVCEVDVHGNEIVATDTEAAA